jgi:PAS domain S-box-containing protein
MMDDAQKTPSQLIEELAILRGRVAALETAETERLQAERAFREGDARLQAILETAVDGIITIDERGVIESFNPAAERLFGYPAEAIIGQNVKVLMPAPYRGAHDAFLARYLATHEKQIIGTGREVAGRRKDGATFPLDLAVSEVRWGNQRLFMGIVRDLTPRKRAEAAVERADRMALLGQFMSGLAHEIGTPLNVIAGNAELLRMDLRQWGFPTEAVESIVGQADRITGLIQQLLHFGRAHDSPLAPIRVQEPLSRATQLVAPRFRREGIVLLFEAPDDLPPVWGVANQLEQVFLNVLVNSWHALPEGGSIAIEAAAPDDRYVRLRIRDNGVGMSADDLARAFEPFYSTKDERGTGLGLTMCRQLIERHGGAIRLDSAPGVGTTVTIILLQADAVGEGPRTDTSSQTLT